MTTDRNQGAGSTLVPPPKYAVGSSCGCFPALVIHEDGTRELAHESWCPTGTKPVAPSVLNGLTEGGITDGA